MRKFIIAVSSALLLMGCVDPLPCTPTKEIPDYRDENGRFHKGGTIEGPKDSGHRYPAKDFASSCQDYPDFKTWDSFLATAYGQAYIKQWEAEQKLKQQKEEAANWLQSKTDQTGYNLVVANDKISEEMILRQYEAEPSEHPNSSTYMSFEDEAEFEKNDKPIYSLVRGPSLRSEDEACKKEMIKDGVFSQVSSKLEVIRGSENVTFHEIRKMRDRIMFQGDNWYWPNKNSACSKAETDMTYRTQYRSSEKPSNFGTNSTCPGNEMFDKISNDELNSTENYNIPRILPTVDDEDLALEYYPAELQVCKDKCFVDTVVDTRIGYDPCYYHRVGGKYYPSSSCRANGGGSGVGIRACKKKGSSYEITPWCNYIDTGYRIVRYNITRKVNVKVPYYTEAVKNGDEITYSKIVHDSNLAEAPEIKFFGTEEQRIACTKCETEQYAQMCRFPKNEIFIVRKK